MLLCFVKQTCAGVFCQARIYSVLRVFSCRWVRAQPDSKHAQKEVLPSSTHPKEKKGYFLTPLIPGEWTLGLWFSLCWPGLRTKRGFLFLRGFVLISTRYNPEMRKFIEQTQSTKTSLEDQIAPIVDGRNAETAPKK